MEDNEGFVDATRNAKLLTFKQRAPLYPLVLLAMLTCAAVSCGCLCRHPTSITVPFFFFRFAS